MKVTEVVPAGSLNTFISSRKNSKLVVLVAALWSGLDRLMIKRGIELIAKQSHIEFGIIAFDKYEEIQDLLLEEKMETIMTPYWLFVKNGKVLNRMSGKIYNSIDLEKQIKFHLKSTT